MASSEIRVEARDHLKWSHIYPMTKDGKLLATRIMAYAADDEEYIMLITPETYIFGFMNEVSQYQWRTRRQIQVG